jgi:predicted RNase H-like HicB family nuclease
MPTIPPYTYHVFWSDEDEEYVACCAEIPGLSGLASTEAGALDELKVAIGVWLAHLQREGVDPPQPAGALFWASALPPAASQNTVRLNNVVSRGRARVGQPPLDETRSDDRQEVEIPGQVFSA